MAIEAGEDEEEEGVEIGRWPLVPYAEIKVWGSTFFFSSFSFFGRGGVSTKNPMTFLKTNRSFTVKKKKRKERKRNIID